MDPLPSKMPKKPRSDTSIEYTGKLYHIYISRSCRVFFVCLFLGLFLVHCKMCLVWSCGKLMSVIQCKFHPAQCTTPQWKGLLRKKMGLMTRAQIRRRKSCKKNVNTLNIHIYLSFVQLWRLHICMKMWVIIFCFPDPFKFFFPFSNATTFCYNTPYPLIEV